MGTRRRLWCGCLLASLLATTSGLVFPTTTITRRGRPLSPTKERKSPFKFAAALTAVRLDAPLIQKSAGAELSGPSLGAMVAMAAAAAGAVCAALLLSFVRNYLSRKPSAPSATRQQQQQVSSSSFMAAEEDDEGALSELVYQLRHFARLRWGTVRASFESLKSWWSGIFEDEPLATLPEVWSPCILEERDQLSDDYKTYRLALKAGPGNVLPLGLGQELTIMCLDDKNRPVRANFPLASRRRDPSGTVEIILPSGDNRSRRSSVGSLDSEQLAVAKALDGLAIGGEAAVRAGRKAFDYKGAYLPITSLQCFVEELGAIPVLQLLQESLVRGQSTVENADVFCISASEDDFVLYDELEDLYYKFNRKMTLACVVDEQLYQQNPADQGGETAASRRARPPQPSIFERNEDLREAVRTWQPGVLAVIAGPPRFANAVSTLLFLFLSRRCASRRLPNISPKFSGIPRSVFSLSERRFRRRFFPN